MVFFNYSIDEILAVSVSDSPELVDIRKDIKNQMEAKYKSCIKLSEERKCAEDRINDCSKMTWKKFENIEISGTGTDDSDLCLGLEIDSRYQHVFNLTPTLSACLLRSYLTLKSILQETLFLDQLHDFSLLSLLSYQTLN